MKVKIVKEVKKSDGLWRFACGDVFYLKRLDVVSVVETRLIREIIKAIIWVE